MAISEHIGKTTFKIKVLELVISIVIIGVISGQIVALNPDVIERMAVIFGTTVTFIILGALIVIGYVLDCPIHAKLILISSATAFVLFATTGGLLVDTYTQALPIKLNRVLAGGVLSLLNAVVYAADALLSWKFS